MNIKIDNMVDLRAFCLEQAVKMKGANFKECKNTMEMVVIFEKYILGDAKLPETPSSLIMYCKNTWKIWLTKERKTMNLSKK